MARNTLFEVIGPMVGKPWSGRESSRRVYRRKRGSRAKEFGLDPPGSEDLIKHFKQGHEATSQTLGTKKSAQEV